MANAIESLNSMVRRAVRSKCYFPQDDATKKLNYLTLRGVAANGSGHLDTGLG